MAVQDIPVPRSYPQQLGSMLDATTSRVGIRRLKVGNPILSVLEAAAQNDVRITQDVFNILAAADLENADGIALDRRGADEKAPRFLVQKATGTVTVGDSSFTKISTKVFQGAAAPIVGSVTIQVEDALAMTASGQVYLGRNTPNIEGPLTYTSKVDNGSYWTLNLSTPTTRFHNRGEGVVLAQGGNRVIDPGTLVATAQGSLSQAVQFSTVFEATIPDGETEVTEVSVVATSPGVIGNAPAETIKEFPAGVPFPGATVINPKPYITGRDTETDNDYRDRLRTVINSKQRGTDLALENSVLGLVSTEENKRISSASLVRRRGQSSILYIDDGSGYEELSQGVGIEVVADSATGGETHFKTLGNPVTKAYLKAAAQAPYNLKDGSKLAIAVGSIVYTHAFDASEFTSIASGSAYELVASINADSSIRYAARTTDSGTSFVIVARDEENEDLAVVAVAAPDTDANDVLLLPVSQRHTALLYKNDRLLSKDGKSAALRSNLFALWNAFTGAQTLDLAVDTTPEATYTFVDQDFIDAGTDFTGVGKNSLNAWTTVINRKIPGLTAVVEGDRLVLTSNKGRSATAGVAISGGSLVSNLAFSTGSSTGTARDYTLDRATGDIVLVNGLAVSDRLTLGSSWTRAFLDTGVLVPTTLVADGTTWWAVDANPEVITHGVGAATPLTATVTTVTNAGFRVSLTAAAPASAFANVAPGDWMVLYEPAVDPSTGASTGSTLPDVLRSAFRVVGTDNDNVVTFEKQDMNVARAGTAAIALDPALAGQDLVLVCGGYTADDGLDTANLEARRGHGVTATCELYDAAAKTWTYVASMTTARWAHTTTLLNNGKVLVTGGYGATGTILSSTEVYDPALDTWTAGPAMSVPRAWHTATRGAGAPYRVLIAGGHTSGTGTATASSQEYDETTNAFLFPATMAFARFGHRSLLMPSTMAAEANNFFVAGGYTAVKTTTVERYNPTTHTWATKASLTEARADMGFEVVDNALLMVAGDGESATVAGEQGTYALYDVAANTWGATTSLPNDFYFENKNIGRALQAPNDLYLLYGFTDDGVAPRSSAHYRYDVSGAAWVQLGPSLSAAAGYEKTNVAVIPLVSSSPEELLCVGGVNRGNSAPQTDADAGVPTAHHELLNLDTEVWSAPDAVDVFAADVLPTRALTFIRTKNYLQKVTVPAAINYTAASYASALSAGLIGASAETYRTGRLRVSTNSFATSRDLLLAASDVSGPLPALPEVLPLEVGVVEENLVGHLASVEAGNAGSGSPFDFKVYELLYSTPSHISDSVRTVYIDGRHIAPTGTLVALKGWDDGLNPDHNGTVLAEYGNAAGFRAAVATMDDLAGTTTNSSDSTRVGLRRDAYDTLQPHQPVIFASPYGFGPEDDLTVVVDQDTETQRFVIPMFRRVRPANSTYGSTVALKDNDAGFVTLGSTFGISYDFNDFAVYMKARAKSHGATASKRILWRYFRPGAEGNSVVVRYAYPDAPSSDIAVQTVLDQDDVITNIPDPEAYRASVNVVLNSGAARTAATIRGTTRLGLARTNGSVSTHVYDTYVMAGLTVVSGTRAAPGGTTTLKVQVPNDGVVANGPQDCGLVPGDVIWFEAKSPTATTLFSGAATVITTGVFNVVTGQQDVIIGANQLHDGTSAWALSANPGTISLDPAGEASFDPATAVDDLFRLEGTALPASYLDSTSRVLSFGKQYLRCRSVDMTTAGADLVPSWTTVGDVDSIVHFQGPTKTATEIAAAVNALDGDTTTCPVSATVTGTGAGVVSQASWDELNLSYGGYTLADGLNYVQRTIDPPSAATDTQFLFRAPITSDLTTDADWAAEDVRLVPVLTEDVAAWLNTPAVTGLWTAAEVSVSDDGTRLQLSSLTPGSAGSVEVQGGTADATTAAVSGSARLITHNFGDTAAVTLPRAESDAIIGNGWVRIDNNFALTKQPFWSSSTTAAIDAEGQWTFDASPYTITETSDNAAMQVEKVGSFVALHFPYQTNASALSVINYAEGAYICIKGRATVDTDLVDVATANRGVYRILRSSTNNLGTTVWIENASAVEQVAEADVLALSPDSVVPGDVWAVSTTAFGTKNRALWQVTEVGTATVGGVPYSTSAFRVEITAETPGVLAATAFGTAVDLVQLREGVPASFVKKVITVTPNQDDGSFVDVDFDTSAGYRLIGASAGSVVSAMNKLDFPAGVFVGVDGYGYGVGLIGEANKVVYGDRGDEATYPGYAATGASILLSGPLVKRITVALALRVQSGLASTSLADRVRSAVASVINSAGIGTAISISDIIGAAASVNGVIAVSVVKPTYSSTSDIISVQTNEKPLVLDLRADIQVSFVGE